MQTIKIEVKGGIVQAVSGVPEDMHVDIHDYDMIEDDGSNHVVITYSQHGHLCESLEISDSANKENMKIIKVELEGGCVQSVSGIPEDIDVEIHDYDNETIGTLKYEYVTYNSYGDVIGNQAYFPDADPEKIKAFEKQTEDILENMLAYYEGRLSAEEIAAIKEKYGNDLYFYALRHSENDWSIPSTIEDRLDVLVNSFGVLVSFVEINFPDYGVIDLADWYSELPVFEFVDNVPNIKLEECGLSAFDVESVAENLSKPVTPVHLRAYVKAVASGYDSKRSDDPTGTWDLYVEDLIYEVLDKM